jgi:hypothetical protein
MRWGESYTILQLLTHSSSTFDDPSYHQRLGRGNPNLRMPRHGSYPVGDI